MNIAFDASDMCTGRADGTTRYTTELAKRLPGLGKEHMWCFYGDCPTPPSLLTGLRGAAQENTLWKSSIHSLGWTQTRFAFELLKDRPDVLFMPIQQLPILRWPKMKTVAVIHDLAFHEYPEQFRYKDWLLLHTFSAQVANEADAIIAISQATKDDIKKYYGREENVHVVHHGIDHDRFRVFSDTEKAESFGKLQGKYPKLQKGYILFVGQIQPRKNIGRLVEAFEKMKGAPQLVIAGGHGWNNKEIYTRIDESPERENIILTGAVPDELLPALYANAQVFVLPSLQEGFGIPLIEAAACGTPLVTSNISSMKEIASDAAVLIDPMNALSIAEGITKALSEKEALQKKSIALAQRFSWEKTAQETMNILKEVISV